jgi:hypothetical protein
MGTKFWRGRKFGNPKKKEVQKREAHKKAPLKKRTKMNLTSFHSLRKSQIGQPMLFFEQRARPPKVAHVRAYQAVANVMPKYTLVWKGIRWSGPQPRFHYDDK